MMDGFFFQPQRCHESDQEETQHECWKKLYSYYVHIDGKHIAYYV